MLTNPRPQSPIKQLLYNIHFLLGIFFQNPPFFLVLESPLIRETRHSSAEDEEA